MLPPNKSEYDQDAAEHDLEEQMRAAQSGDPEPDGLNGPDDVLDLDADAAALDPDADDEDLGQEEEPKPKKKGIGKGTIFAAAGAAVVVALCGVAYVLQGQMQAPAPVTKKIAIDPSLLESKPSTAASTPVPVVVTPPVSMEITPNLGAPSTTAPTLSSPASVSAITAPPSDPFGGTTTAPVATTMPSSTPSVMPVMPIPAVTIPAVTIPAKTVAITPAPGVDAPRADPFGSVVPEKILEPAAKPVANVEKAVKPNKVVKAKSASVDIDEGETVKPRVAKKTVSRKPRVIRQDMTVSEPHPSQEQVQPQSSENFHGYEKLF